MPRAKQGAAMPRAPAPAKQPLARCPFQNGAPPASIPCESVLDHDQAAVATLEPRNRHASLGCRPALSQPRLPPGGSAHMLKPLDLNQRLAARAEQARRDDPHAPAAIRNDVVAAHPLASEAAPSPAWQHAVSKLQRVVALK